MSLSLRPLAKWLTFTSSSLRRSHSRISRLCVGPSKLGLPRRRAPSLNVNQRVEKFPRSTDLPVQSPLFWVEQKDRYLRQLLIRDLEELTGRRLVVYFANRFENA